MRSNFLTSVRLAAALLASLSMHLLLVAQLVDLHWPRSTGSAGAAWVLEAHLAPAGVGQRLAAPELSPPYSPRPSLEASAVAPPTMPQQLAGKALAAEPAADAVDAPLSPGLAAVPAQAPLPQESPALELSPHGKLNYQFYWGRSRWLAGEASHEWVIANGYYSFTSIVRSTGLFGLLRPVQLVETAKGMLVGDSLRPLQFSTQFNDKQAALVMFNWDKGSIRTYGAQGSTTQSLPASSYDKISFLYQLCLTRDMRALSLVHITTGRQLDDYAIEDLGLETVEIGERSYPSIHLRRAAPLQGGLEFDIWISEQHRLPLKMAYATVAGDYFEQLISADSMPSDAAAALR